MCVHVYVKGNENSMAYSLKNAYKDVEQILCRTMNSFEIMKIDNWFSRYESDYLEWSINELKKMTNIYSTNFIDNFLFRNYETFTKLKQFFSSKDCVNIDINQQQQQQLQENKYINDWDEYDEETRAYWTAKLKYTFYPNEFTDPDNL